MKKLACADLGTENCPFVAEGETEEEVKGKMMSHAAELHPEKLEGLDDAKKAEMDQLMNDNIKDA